MVRKKKRRQYSAEFKREAVELVTVQGCSVAAAARNLGISENLLHTWKKKLTAREDQPLTEDERMEMARLIEENRRLRMERDILKKATAFFANEKP